MTSKPSKNIVIELQQGYKIFNNFLFYKSKKVSEYPNFNASMLTFFENGFLNTGLCLIYKGYIIPHISYLELEPSNVRILSPFSPYIRTKYSLVYKKKVIKKGSKDEWNSIKYMGLGWLKTNFSLIKSGRVVKRVFSISQNDFLKDCKLLNEQYFQLGNGLLYSAATGKKFKEIDNYNVSKQYGKYFVNILPCKYVQTPHKLIYDGKVILSNLSHGTKVTSLKAYYVRCKNRLIFKGKTILHLRNGKRGFINFYDFDYIRTNSSLLHGNRVIHYNANSVICVGNGYFYADGLIFFMGIIVGKCSYGVVPKFKYFSEAQVLYMSEKDSLIENHTFFIRGEKVKNNSVYVSLYSIMERSEKKIRWSSGDNDKFSEEMKDFVTLMLCIHKYSKSSISLLPKDVLIYKILPLLNEMSVFISSIGNTYNQEELKEETTHEKDSSEEDTSMFILENIFTVEKSGSEYSKKMIKKRKLRKQRERKIQSRKSRFN